MITKAGGVNLAAVARRKPRATTAGERTPPRCSPHRDDTTHGRQEQRPPGSWRAWIVRPAWPAVVVFPRIVAPGINYRPTCQTRPPLSNRPHIYQRGADSSPGSTGPKQSASILPGSFRPPASLHKNRSKMGRKALHRNPPEGFTRAGEFTQELYIFSPYPQFGENDEQSGSLAAPARRLLSE